jgi:hypothetical protein
MQFDFFQKHSPRKPSVCGTEMRRLNRLSDQQLSLRHFLTSFGRPMSDKTNEKVEQLE